VVVVVNHKNLGKNILELAKVFPDVKSSYSKLVMYYWTFFEDCNSMGSIQYCTSPESITRAFRKLVENGLILVPAETKANREAAAKNYKNDFANL
jgi:hypothetical protein